MWRELFLASKTHLVSCTCRLLTHLFDLSSISGTNFDWQLWALSVCSLTIAGAGCDFGDFNFLSGLSELSFSAEKANLGRKLLSRLQDTTKDANRRLIGGPPDEAFEYLLIGGGLSLLGGTLFTDCNDGAAVVLRDFEFFEVVLNVICYETGHDHGTGQPYWFCNLAKPIDEHKKRRLSRHLVKKAKKVAQNLHKALQQEYEHGRKLRDDEAEQATSIELIVGIIFLVIGLLTT